MDLSYWEYKTWLSHIDYLVIGSGIVGLNCALQLRNRFPLASILILEKGILPQGASTKNAGFACFGSISEIVADLQHHSEEEVLELVHQRWQGLQLLRHILGDKAIGYKNNGGYEVFLKQHEANFNHCHEKLGMVNSLLKPIFKENAFQKQTNSFHFKNVIKEYIMTPLESQIDTGEMMSALLNLVRQKGINILNAITVEDVQDTGNGVAITTNAFECMAKKVCIATNGFAHQFLKENIRPARAQVLITKPIRKLHIKGTFHLDMGFYYFRNVGNRILLGGGRNLDFKTEETTTFGETEIVQNQLENLLKYTILPNIPYSIERRWSGIMGVGDLKKPIVKQLSSHVYCGVRLGGMGIAIGSSVGKELANLI